MPIARSNFCVSLWFLSHVTFWLRANHILDGDNKDACQLKKITKSYLFEYFNKWKCYQEWSITQIIKLIKVPFIWEDCIHVLQKFVNKIVETIAMKFLMTLMWYARFAFSLTKLKSKTCQIRLKNKSQLSNCPRKVK